jgi:hypothetical protein
MLTETANWLEVLRMLGGMLVVLFALLLMREFVADRRQWHRDGHQDRIVGWWLAGAVRLKLTIAWLGAIEAYSAYSAALTADGLQPTNVYWLSVLRLGGLAALVLLSIDRYAMRRHFTSYANRRDRRWSDKQAVEILSKEQPSRDPRGAR